MTRGLWVQTGPCPAGGPAALPFTGTQTLARTGGCWERCCGRGFLLSGLQQTRQLRSVHRSRGAELLHRGPGRREGASIAPTRTHRYHRERSAFQAAAPGCQRTWDTASAHAFTTRASAGLCRERGARSGPLTCPGPSGGTAGGGERCHGSHGPRSAGRERRLAQAARHPSAGYSLAAESSGLWQFVLLVAYSIGIDSPALFPPGYVGAVAGSQGKRWARGEDPRRLSPPACATARPGCSAHS